MKEDDDGASATRDSWLGWGARLTTMARTTGKIVLAVDLARGETGECGIPRDRFFQIALILSQAKSLSLILSIKPLIFPDHLDNLT